MPSQVAAGAACGAHAQDGGRAAPPLTAAQAVCRARLGVDMLASVVSAFVDPTPRVAIERAAELGDVRLLQRVVDDHHRDGSRRITDRHYTAHVVTKALVHAVQHGNDLELLECLFAFSSSLGAAASGWMRGSGTRAVTAAVELGKVHVLEWLVKRFRYMRLNTEHVYLAAEKGHVPMLEWLVNNCEDAHLSRQVADCAVTGGHLHVLKWLQSESSEAAEDPEFFLYALVNAAQRGDLATVKWIYETIENMFGHEYFEEGPLESAVTHGHWDVVMFLHEQGYRVDPKRLFPYAIEAPVSLECVQWLVANGFENVSRSLFIGAAKAGNVDVVQWLLKTQSSAVRHACDNAVELAAMGGYVEIVELLLPMPGSPGFVNALKSAAHSGHADVVQLMARSMDPNVGDDLAFVNEAVECAVDNGHVEIAQWLHARRARKGANGDEDLPCYDINIAARNGQLEGLKWIAANASYDHDFLAGAIRGAVWNGHLDVVVWLLKRHGGDIPNLIDIAAARGHLHVVEWLHKNCGGGCTTQAMDGAAGNNHLHVVKWLHEHRTEGCTTQAMDAAAATTSLEMVQWLHEHRAEGCTTQAMDNAAAEGDFETLLFLHEHRAEGCSVNAAMRAFGRDHMDVVCWLFDNYPSVMRLEHMGSFGQRHAEYIAAVRAGEAYR